jgi:hypothetical protein
MPRNPQVEAYIRQAAIARGIDPDYAVKVSASEALNVFDPSASRDGGGDGGSSFGPFQLHYGGVNKAMPNGGLGDEFTRSTGLDARNPSTWQKQVDFALDTAKRDGWRQWMGAANTGIPRWAGIKPGAAPTQAAQPPVMDGPRGQEQIEPAGYSTRPQGPVEAAGGGGGSDPRGVLAGLFTNSPGGPVEAAGGGGGSEAGAGAEAPAATDPVFSWDRLTKGLGKMSGQMAAGGGPQRPPQGPGTPAAARVDAPDVAPYDPTQQDAFRQQLALAMQRLNSGRLF